MCQSRQGGGPIRERRDEVCESDMCLGAFNGLYIPLVCNYQAFRLRIISVREYMLTSTVGRKFQYPIAT
jgi:hypothetical protein